MAASNTKDCFREFIGKTVRGVLFDALPTTKPAGNKTLIFEDGRGLTFSSNGAFWIDDEAEVQRAIKLRLSKLQDSIWEMEETLRAAGVPVPPTEKF